MVEAVILLGLYIVYTFVYGVRMRNNISRPVRERVIPQAVISTAFLVVTYVAVLLFDGQRALAKSSQNIIALTDNADSMERFMIALMFVAMMGLCLFGAFCTWAEDTETASSFIQLVMSLIATVAYVGILMYCSTSGSPQKDTIVQYENSTTQYIG